MRFLLDESADARLRFTLQAQGHDVRAIALDYPASLTDPGVLDIAYTTGRILITRDRDFGELVFVRQQPHAGEILPRLGSAPPRSPSPPAATRFAGTRPVEPGEGSLAGDSWVELGN